MSKAGGDPGEESLGCASVLSRCPTAHSADTLWRLRPAAQRGQHMAEVPAAAREDLQAKSAGRATLPPLATVWSQLTGSWCSLHPGLRFLAAGWGFVQLQKQYLVKHAVREIRFYLDFKPNENTNKHGLLQCNLDT